MYRVSWLLVAFPLLIALLSVTRPSPLSAPALPPTFDGRAAHSLAGELATLHPDRSPGSPGALGAARWVTDRMNLYGFTTANGNFETDRFMATIPGRGRVRLANLVAVAKSREEAEGRLPEEPVIVVMAHRDNAGTGPGANDNGSGTAALIELARAYAKPPGPTTRVQPLHPIVFLSTDAGVYGGLGAQRFADTSVYRRRVVAVINLDAIAGSGKPRLELTGDTPRSPAAALVETAAARIFDQTGADPGRTSALGQLIDLAFPFSLYEQAPFVGRGIPAVTLTTSGDRPEQPFGDNAKGLNVSRIGQIGRAAQSLLGSLDLGIEPAQGTSSYLYLGTRYVRGWAIQLVLISMLVPFLAAAVDLFARCRRRGIALRPALRAYRARLLFWLLVGALFELFAVTGAWPKGEARPLDPSSSAANHWPALELTGFAALIGLVWLAARRPLVPRRPATAEEELAGHTAALLALGLLALLVVATNPFALIFLLPSLHAWLWLPQVRETGRGTAFALFCAGLLGPLLLLGSFGSRFGLGFDAPWYVAELVAVGYVGLGPLALALAWAAGASQLLVLSSGRYAAYPSRRDLPRGPLREVVRGLILTILRVRAERRVTQREKRAL